MPLDEWTPPCLKLWPRELLPGRRSLRDEFRLAAYHFRLFYVAIAQRLYQLRPCDGLIVWPVPIDKLAYDNLSRHGEPGLTCGSAVAHFALLFVVLHSVETVAQLVAPLVERGTGRDHF